MTLTGAFEFWFRETAILGCYFGSFSALGALWGMRARKKDGLKSGLSRMTSGFTLGWCVWLVTMALSVLVSALVD